MRVVGFALLSCAAVSVASAQSAELPIAWDSAAPGVWMAAVGTPDAVTLLGVAGIQPKRDALSRLPSVTFPLERAEIRAFEAGRPSRGKPFHYGTIRWRMMSR